jgi:UDP-N-acetylglucosamine acyltransferase
MNHHPTAIIDPKANVAEDTFIGPYCIIESGVCIGPGTRIDSHAKICSGTTMGSNCRVHAHAVLGEDPQYIGFDKGIDSGVSIGNDCVFREHTTIHRSIYEGKQTVLHDRVYMMVNSHVAHDCELHEGVILTNAALIAGHVTVGKNAYVGGGAAIHQYVRIGDGAMVGGLARITMDVAPFLMVSERDEVSGLNLVGLKRRGVSRHAIKALKDLYHILFEEQGNIRKLAAEQLESRAGNLPPEIKLFLEFFGGGKRGFCGVNLKSGK